MFITDSCECGIGVFSMKTGRAFRFELPVHSRFRVSNNILECLAGIVAIWLALLEGDLLPNDCAFAGMDSTIAIG